MASPRGADQKPSGAAPQEVEWQFDALDLRPVERWLASLPLREAPGDGEGAGAGMTAQGQGARRLVDRYLDTDDWRLHRAGLVLRVRHRGRREEVTLKDIRPVTATGLRTRLEVSEPLGEGDLAGLGSEGPVGRRLRAVAGRRPLQEVLTVRTRRRPFSLRLAGREVAEVALDETVLGHPRQHPAHLQRVEVELTGGNIADLESLVEEMRAACGLRPATLSKFEAGLLALGIEVPGPPELGAVEVTESSSIGELAFAVLRRQLGVLLAREPGTRLGEDIEELHDMRVATRRLRAALDVFAGVVGPRARTLRDELAWLAAVLGDVRDLDVQLERMGEMERWTAPWLAADSAVQPLVELEALLVRQRESARERLLDALESPRWTRLAQALTTLARQGPNRRLAAVRLPAAQVVPGLVEERHRAVVKAARRAKRTRLPADFHRLRIRAKRLRYSLEFATGIYGSRPERFTRRLARLQDALGLMQDAEVATHRLLNLATGSEPPLSPLTVFAMGAVGENYRLEAQALLEGMPGHLEVLTGRAWQDLADHMDRARRLATTREPSTRPRRQAAAPVAGRVHTEEPAAPSMADAAPLLAAGAPDTPSVPDHRLLAPDGLDPVGLEPEGPDGEGLDSDGVDAEGAAADLNGKAPRTPPPPEPIAGAGAAPD